MTLNRFPFIVVTAIATERMIVTFGSAPDILRWVLLYGIAVVMPWAFYIYECRRGSDERMAAAPLGVGPVTLMIATGLIAPPGQGAAPAPAFPWSLLVGAGLFGLLFLLQKFRVVR